MTRGTTCGNGETQVGGQVQRRKCRVPSGVYTSKKSMRHLRGDVKQADCLLNITFGQSMTTYFNAIF